MISLLKNFKKKSTKAKIGIIAFIVFMVLLVSYVLYSNFKPEPPAEYEMTKVTYGTVVDTLDVVGKVESGVTENFVAIEGVTVEEVLVNVGDKVNKGDKLATFNVSGAAQYLDSAKKEYDKALKDYNDAKQSADSNSKRKVELASEIDKKNAEITAKKNEIAKLEKEIENNEPVTEMTGIPQEQIDAIAMQMAQNGATKEEIDAFIASASSTKVPVASTDNSKTEELMQKNLELSQLNSELSSLQAENAVVSTGDNDSMLETLKKVADTKEITYKNIKAIYDSMKNGWYAENDGIVTVVNIKAGEKFVPVATNSSSIDISALLGSSGMDANTTDMINSLVGSTNGAPTGTGITFESYDDMIVSVTVGKSDLLKIKVGMEAVVTSLDTQYEGEVVYVGATAVESNSLNLGSLMGTGTGASGAVVKVKIKNPDEKIVIGFDVDIKIKLATVENVLKVPVECVLYENGKYYVFVFDMEEGVAVKREITKGTLDDTSYQIVDGLAENEIVLKSPDPKMEDGIEVKEKAS